MNEPRYCSICGSPLDVALIENHRRSICKSCGHIHYLNPIPSVVALIEKDGAVLLVQRAVEPRKGDWCLPGGFIETGETIAEAVVREVMEETGLECHPLEVLDVCSDLDGFYGDILVVCYRVQNLGGTLKAGDDAANLDFFTRDNIPRLAFRCHVRFLEKFWEQKLAFSMRH
jgi:ADP-ribose pyrophosphatase YjhB (NUDIX family)